MTAQRTLDPKTAVAVAYSTLAALRALEETRELTFEQALEDLIARVDGDGTTGRPGELARVDKIESDLLAAARALRDGGS